MKWIYWTIVVILILGLLSEVSATHRRKRNRNLRNRNKNTIKRRAFLKRKHLEELFADNENDDDDLDDYYDSFHLGRSATDKKSEIKEEEVPTNTGTQATAAAAELGPEKDAVEGADSERLIGTGNNAVFSSFLTKKQNILNQWTTSTTTIAPTVTTTQTATITGPVTLVPTTGAATAVPADAVAQIAQPAAGAVAQRVTGTGGRRQVVVQYRPIVIRQTNRRRPVGHGHRRRPVIGQNSFGGIGGIGGLAGGNVVRVPVRVQAG